MFALILSALLLLASAPTTSTQKSKDVVAEAQRLIRQQRFNDAVNRLELFLETTPSDAEALAFYGTAQMYADRDFLKAQQTFEASFSAGGGASFWVNHSHQSSFDGDDLTDYCRGWLHLRKEGVEYVPDEGDHGFRMPYSDIAEFKQNRFKTFFHIKREGKHQNFRPRTAEQRETLLILVLYKKFAR